MPSPIAPADIPLAATPTLQPPARPAAGRKRLRSFRVKRLALLLSAPATLALAGCTTVRSEALATDLNKPAHGLVYYLPVRTMHVESKFIVTDCGLVRATGKAELLYEVVPTVTLGVAADRRRPFVIREGLEGKALKALNVEIATYENGTLKSFNAVADDRTAETATNVISGALKFGLGLTGMGLFSAASATEEEEPPVVWLREIYRQQAAPAVPAAQKGKKKKGAAASAPARTKTTLAQVRSACGPRLTDALMKVHDLTSKVDGAQEATDAKARLAAAVANAEKAVSEARLGLKAAKETEGAEDLALAQATLSAAVKKLIEARAKLEAGPTSAAPSSISQQISYIVQRDLTFSAATDIVPFETPGDSNWPLSYPKANLEAQGVKATKGLDAAVELALISPNESATAFGTLPARQTIDEKIRVAGIWTRTPAMARLRVCLSDACGNETVRLSQAISVPQWGQISVIPLKNMVFARNSMKLAFAPDGTLTNLNFESTAAAERGSAAFAQSGEMFLDFVTKRRALLAELAAADSAAEKAEIQQQIDVVNLQAQLAQAQSSIGPDRQNRLNQLQFEIDEAKKEVELIEAQRKRDALRSGSE